MDNKDWIVESLNSDPSQLNFVNISPNPLKNCDTTKFFNMIVSSEGVYKLTIKYESVASRTLGEQITGEAISDEDATEEQTLMIIAKDGVYAIFDYQNGLESNMKLFNLRKATTY